MGSAGDYINAFEKFRDPSHGRCLSMDEWRSAYDTVGLFIEHEEVLVKPMTFESWAARHDVNTQRYLKAMLTEVRDEAAEFLQPQFGDEATIFHLREGLFIGRKA
jgi:hypothetical protein